MTENNGEGKTAILKKMQMLMQKTGYLQKTGRNRDQGYTYLTDEALSEAVRVAAIEVGVVITFSFFKPELTALTPTKEGKPQMRTEMLGEVTFWDVDTGQSLTMSVVGSGNGRDDKGPYGAMTGLKKYALRTNLLIPTGDDAESDGSGAPKPKTYAKKPTGDHWPSHQITDPQATTGKPDQATPAQIAAIEKMTEKLPGGLEKERYETWLAAPNRPKAIASGMIGELQKTLDGVHQ